VAAAEDNTRVGLARSMASAGARAYNGGLGAEPPAGVQGAEPPVGDQGGKAPWSWWHFSTGTHIFCAIPEAFFYIRDAVYFWLY